MPGQGHKRQVDGVEHEFNRHEDNNDITAQENARHADSEQDAAQNEMITGWDHLPPSKSIGSMGCVASVGSDSKDSTDAQDSTDAYLYSFYRFAKTTAPTTATNRRMPVISKGSRYVVKS